MAQMLQFDRYYSRIGLMLERRKPSSSNQAPTWRLFVHDFPEHMIPCDGDRVTFLQLDHGAWVAHPESLVKLTISTDRNRLDFTQDVDSQVHDYQVQVRKTYLQALMDDDISFSQVQTAASFLNPTIWLVPQPDTLTPPEDDERMVLARSEDDERMVLARSEDDECMVLARSEDDECMVCFDLLGREQLFGCPDCRKVVHLACAMTWISTAESPTCVHCRSPSWSKARTLRR